MASLKFNNVYINKYYSIAGPKEKLGKIKNYDLTIDDYYFQEKTFEQAEIKMQNDEVSKRKQMIKHLINELNSNKTAGSKF